MEQVGNEGLARGMKKKLQCEEKAIRVAFDSGLQRRVDNHSQVRSCQSVRIED
jgi:hypothetical protein